MFMNQTILIALYVLIRYKRTDLLRVIHWGNAVVFDSLNKRLIEFLFQVTGLHWSHYMFVHLKGSSSQESFALESDLTCFCMFCAADSVAVLLKSIK